MHFALHHQTHYRYDAPIVLAPHRLRLTPRPGEHQLLARTLLVRPQPLEVRDEIDAFGNQVTHVSFSGRATSELHVDSRFELLTSVPAPALGGGLAPLPWAPLVGPEAAAFLPVGAGADLAVAAFARTVAGEVGWQALPFLDHLCRSIHGSGDRHIRLTGDAQSAAETLATWRGACRDYTVLFMAAARSLGIPARFCSGYQAAAQTPDDQRYLHAWPEVFLPGAGWHGWDPTYGIPVGDGHVTLCAGAEQADTMPVSGGFYFGDRVTSTLNFSVNIRTT